MRATLRDFIIQRLSSEFHKLIFYGTNFPIVFLSLTKADTIWSTLIIWVYLLSKIILPEAYRAYLIVTPRVLVKCLELAAWAIGANIYLQHL